MRLVAIVMRIAPQAFDKMSPALLRRATFPVAALVISVAMMIAPAVVDSMSWGGHYGETTFGQQIPDWVPKVLYFFAASSIMALSLYCIIQLFVRLEKVRQRRDRTSLHHNDTRN